MMSLSELSSRVHDFGLSMQVFASTLQRLGVKPGSQQGFAGRPNARPQTVCASFQYSGIHYKGVLLLMPTPQQPCGIQNLEQRAQRNHPNRPGSRDNESLVLSKP